MSTRPKGVALVLGLVMILSMVLAACQPAAPVVQTVIVTEEVLVEGTPVVQERVIVVTPTPQPPTEAPPTPVPQPVDTVVLALQQEPDTLHPLIG